MITLRETDLEEAVLYIAGHARAVEVHPLDQYFRAQLNQLVLETIPLDCHVMFTRAGAHMMTPHKAFVPWPAGLSEYVADE
jgi:hypothetical protein